MRLHTISCSLLGLIWTWGFSIVPITQPLLSMQVASMTDQRRLELMGEAKVLKVHIGNVLSRIQ